MLKENFFYLIVSLTGILLLYFYSFSSAGINLKINELTDSMLDSIIVINARIDSYYLRENLFLQLNDGTGKIKAVKFNPEINDLIFVQENKFVKVKGKLTKKNESFELIVLELNSWK